ncbi:MULTISPECIES: hypothetical protein [unclassified Microbacterium]|uniref:hypothetical protein n=1 Tax=unclassified Microbacterium TaxID=2609290 RepID=UPI0012F8B3D6|nr:hypothetical protein [Microbacterium sp. MAH-37]MVQ43901.1 hypothetical protein [Microbacterium sp. MAH-37]
MTAHRVRATLLATLMIFGLTGCAQTSPEDTLNVEEAKAIAQAGASEISEHVPAELVVSVKQNATGVLLSCEGDRNYTWTGRTVVTLTEDADVTDVIDGIYSVYADQEGWTARRKESAHGDPQVIIDGPDSNGYLITGDAEPSTIDLDSYSPCFHLPDGQSSRGSF